jgi:hypothetical protein
LGVTRDSQADLFDEESKLVGDEDIVDESLF